MHVLHRFRPCWLLLAAAAACSGSLDYEPSGDGDGAGAPDGGAGACLSSSECPTGYVCNDFGRCEIPSPTGDGGVPPPQEVEYDVGEPVSSQQYVYVALTEQDELARIDGRTLEVVSRPVGDAPRVVAAIPGTDGAVVLDATNGTASIVRPAGDTDTVRVLPTLPHLNRLDLDPTGRFAVIWFDLAKAIQDGGIGGIGSFQDVTVLLLAPGGERAVNLTVGFRPREVEFDAAGTRAYVVTEDGVSVIDLAIATTSGPAIVPPIPIADPLTPPTDIEVDVVPSGDHAAVRRAGVSSLRVVRLGAGIPGQAHGQLFDIPLPSPPTDIDLAPDGTRVYAVLREAKQLAIVDVPGDALDPGGVELVDLAAATIGSLVLSRDGTRALLFTNATLDERLTMVRLDQPGFPAVTWPMKKAARAVGLSPTGTTAFVLHAKAPGDPDEASSIDDYIDKSYGYSLIDLATGFAKLQLTPVDPGPFVYAPDGAKIYVALDGGDVVSAPRALQIVQTQTGVVTSKQLGSPPSAVGVLPGAGEAFAAQRHPLGRITFVNLATDGVRTVTGFDLNGDIVD
jgi:DNA-binding beta-propeller fold protein YncE